AEKAMSPVVAVLKDKADITVNFIANVSGETPETIQSLHGANEAMEDLRQLCIVQDYDELALWKYLDKFNATCPSLYSDAAALDACWKKAAQDSNVDAAKIDSCSKTKEAVALLKSNETLTTQYGVSGSPTMIINGTQVNPDRTPEGYKQAVCNAFNTAPEECAQVLSSTSATVSGSCS
ncbi:MAG: thioredoxin domain-containing protein, partial [Candidatus ainarchaeum sp.]|nr:thioredoxin domain-containing protein [Candidatus ainarchaeum sp.]